MKTVTKEQFIEILSKVKGATPISFTARIDAKAKKKNNPFGEIFKVSRVSAFTSFDYENSVIKQQIREGKSPDFQASERAWGERVSSALVKNKDKFYLVAKVERARSPIYFYNDNGVNKIVDVAKIREFLPVVKPTSQGLEKEVIYRNYAIDNLISVSLNKEKYKIV